MRLRKAISSEAGAIFRLIGYYADQGLLLPRSIEDILDHIEHFLVAERAGTIVGCVALEKYSSDLAEIRSLAVENEMRGQGLGARLVEFVLDEARQRRITRVFAVTHAPKFFVSQGFAQISRHSLTEKIERDCRACKQRRTCRLTAVVATTRCDSILLPILDGSATPEPVAEA